MWISGASGELGSKAVETFLALGCHVVASARRRTRLLNLRAELKNHERLKVAENDAADPEGVEALLDGLFREAPLDIAVQCAGAFHYEALAETDDGQVRRLVESNLLASTWMLRGCLRRMRPLGAGQVVLVSAEGAQTPSANLAVYGATKAAVAHLVEAADQEVRSSGVRVFGLLPGTLDTQANRAAGMDPAQTPMVPLGSVCETMVRVLSSADDEAPGPLVPVRAPRVGTP